jgi:phosphohistidine swiveling domain-containing protein
MLKNEEEIIRKARSLDWEYWLERPFGGFMISLFQGGNSRQSFEKVGIKGVEMEFWASQNRVWYQSGKVWKKMEKKLGKYLAEHSIFDITDILVKFRREKKKRIGQLVRNKGVENTEKLMEFAEIMSQMTSFLWLAHGLEVYYANKLKKAVPLYIKKDVDLFIGDASFPAKKNAHALMEEMIAKKVSPEKIVAKYGWVKIRDGFSEGFSEMDIRAMKIKKHEKHKRVRIPGPLKELFKEVQELVYFRTFRTDVFYELIFTARPLIKAAAEEFGIPYKDLADYTIHSLIAGKPQKIEMPFTAIGYKQEIIYLGKEILKGLADAGNIDIRGVAAQKGVVRGRVRLVRSVADVDSVKPGDIMVARMTFPAYIMGMKRAAGFVTDEGGLTCHAAIVAREMRKPCIIGTKNATKVLKNGDMVEVDADSGVVRLIK